LRPLKRGKYGGYVSSALPYKGQEKPLPPLSRTFGCLNVQLKSQRLKQDIEYGITTEDVIDMWEMQGGKCALSGVLMTHQRDGTYGDRKKKEFNASIDRINPQGPYVRENVQLVAARVNTMKHTLGEDMFMWWVKNIYETELSDMLGVLQFRSEQLMLFVVFLFFVCSLET
jgi:hypothetical protein